MELLVSISLGVVVLAVAVKLFSQSVDASWVVSQRAEMQQDLRASSDLLMKDLSLAGAGLPPSQGIALPNGAGAVRPIYGCDQVGNCIPGGGIAYPCASPPPAACPGVPTLYGLIPGYRLGIVPPGSPPPGTDVVTVVYSDNLFALNCYNVTFPANGNVNPVTFTLPNPLPPTCVLPPGLAAPQAVNDPVVGLTAGDVLLFQNTLPAGTTGRAVAEVTPPNVAGGAGTYTATFANNDPLELNQSGAAAGDLAQIIGGANTTAMRILVITYFLKVQPDPLGVGPGIPVLMRQVNGHTAVPVAENTVNLQFTYDTYNSDGTLLNNVGDGGYSTGTALNLIRKINVIHLTMRSQLSGTRSALMATSGYQSFDLQTAISARNLSYQNRYCFSNCN
jgi:hypothetical protein